MKKSLTAIALAGSIALIGAVPAVAANYPAPPPNAAVSDGVVGPGETFVFSGRGFLAGETIVINVTRGARPASTGASIAGGPSRSVPSKIAMAPQTFTTTADSNGTFAFPLNINEPGVYTLTATGQTSGIVVSATVTVVGRAAGAADLANAGGQPLANTGTDASLLLWGAAGVAALGLGAGGVIMSRRRTKASA
jgi:LPXTG-motif cell wall-anchored protein